MKAEELLQCGQVQTALESLQQGVRSDPGNVRLRASLFEVFSVIGQWERATAQLKAAASLDASTLLLSHLYSLILEAESLRDKIFRGTAAPVIFGEPEPWMAKSFQGIQLIGEGKNELAGRFLQEALDAAPSVPGTIDGAPCQWLADADLRLGPFLEAMIDGKYFWVPFFRIKQLRIQPPKNLRDLLWPSAQFQWSNGGEAPGFIFARYPGTETATDGELLLTRKTEWREQPGGLAFGCGQRLLATETTDYPLLDMRAIDFPIS